MNVTASSKSKERRNEGIGEKARICDARSERGSKTGEEKAKKWNRTRKRKRENRLGRDKTRRKERKQEVEKENETEGRVA
jgi:hypothetical protein